MSKNKKKLWIVPAVIAGALVLGVAALAVFFPTDFIRDRVVAAIESKLRRPVSVGEVHLSIFPSFGADIDDVRIGETPEPGRPQLAAASLRVRVRLLPLIHREVEITSVSLEGLEVAILTASPDGRAASAKNKAPNPQPPATPRTSRLSGSAGSSGDAEGGLAREGAAAEGGPAVESGHELHFKINELTVRDGNVSVRKPDGSPLIELGGISEDLNAQGTSTGDLRLAGITRINSLRVHLPAGDLGQGMQLQLEKKLYYSRASDSLFVETADLDLNGLPISVHGRAGLVSSGRPAVDIALRGGPAEVSDILGYLPSAMFPQIKGIESKGTINIQASVQSRPTPAGESAASDGKLDFRVALALSNGRIVHPDLPAPIEGIGLQATITPKVADITDFTAASGTSRVRARAKISDYDKDPAIDAALDADLDLQEVAALKLRPDVPGLQGRVAAQLSARGAARDPSRLDLAGIVDLRSVRIEDPNLAAPVEDLNGRVLIHDKDLTLEALSGRSGSSDFSVQGTLANYPALEPGNDTESPARIELILKSRMLAIDELTSPTEKSMAAAASTGAEGGMGAGTGVAQPPAAAAVAPLARLTGTIQFSADKVRTKELETGAASGLATIDRGLIRIDRLDAKAFGGDLALQGTVDLRTGAPQFSLKAQAQKVRASDLFTSVKSLNSFSRMGGFLTGEIDAHATFDGNLNEAHDLNLGDLTSIGDLTIHDAKIVDQPLQVAIADFLEAPQLKSLAILDWFQPFRIENGRLIVENLNFKAGQVEVSAGGWQSLDGKLEMNLEILLPQDLSAGVRKHIPNELAPILFDESGSSILVPVRLSGSYQSPKVAVDSDRLTAEARAQAQKKLDAERQRLEEEARTRAKGFLDGLVKTPADTATTKQKASEVEKNIKKSLKDLFKKK